MRRGLLEVVMGAAGAGTVLAAGLCGFALHYGDVKPAAFCGVVAILSMGLAYCAEISLNRLRDSASPSPTMRHRERSVVAMVDEREAPWTLDTPAGESSRRSKLTA